jgi:hypothetical protein
MVGSPRRHGGPTRTLSAAVVALVLGVCLLALGDPRDAPAVLPRGAIRLEIGSYPVGPVMPDSFVGLSLEYFALPRYVGRDPAHINPVFVRLVGALSPDGSPVIRFGGDSTDWTWWPVKGVPQPPGIRYVLTRRWLAVARATTHALGAHLILGINLEAGSRTLAGAEARALMGGLGRGAISAFELGNEPEVYGTIGWYTNRAGVGVPGRAADYGISSYLADYAAIGSALPRNVPLAGPAVASSDWQRAVGPFVAANPRARLVTVHVYPLRRCRTALSSASYPTIAHLLASPATARVVDAVRSAVDVIGSRRVAVRVDELNSVSCKGASGVSDTFASALWVLDTLFRLYRAGVMGVNIHTLANVPYQPFTFARSSGRWRASVKPMYYGLLLFDRAAPPGARLVPTLHTARSALRSWATVGPDGTTRLVLINDSEREPLTIAVAAPHSAASASLELLRAPGLRATAGVSLAGQGFGARTSTGRLAGAFEATSPQQVQRRYVVRVPPASAALLTLEPR